MKAWRLLRMLYTSVSHCRGVLHVPMSREDFTRHVPDVERRVLQVKASYLYGARWQIVVKLWPEHHGLDERTARELRKILASVARHGAAVRPRAMRHTSRDPKWVYLPTEYPPHRPLRRHNGRGPQRCAR